MKKIFILFFCTALLSAACQPKSDTTATTTITDSTKTDSSKTAQGKVYYCPMCTGQESDKPGKCAHCGMDLEKKQ
jgi:hypothetical protein